ncbi:TerB family tellurite resistance protein [Agrobacterium tumefaciens]|uniref:tellurite resistance TerB family protein n=1 Tax=Agrobacterium tumefaciens TaxID=358 RepID=UPI00287EB51C|nr:TerB family tellurite resistance protein [Agrobacterium tumefaciens]MDS7598079.1 TerB family tellurite resistance protein [Agrobacterium tumefaciens]
MLNRIQSFFQTLVGQHTDDFSPDDLRVAVAALCFQVMEADGTVSKTERDRLREILQDYYHLNSDKLDALLAAGQEAGKEAVDYYRFTTDIRRHLGEDQRVELIGILWDIVYADGERSEMEDHVIWRVADLMGVSVRDRVLQRQQAAKRSLSAEESENDKDAV